MSLPLPVPPNSLIGGVGYPQQVSGVPATRFRGTRSGSEEYPQPALGVPAKRFRGTRSGFLPYIIAN